MSTKDTSDHKHPNHQQNRVTANQQEQLDNENAATRTSRAPNNPQAKPVFDQRDKDLAHRNSPDPTNNPSNTNETEPDDASVAVGSTVLYRDAPETQGGPTRAVVTNSDVEAHERRGWYKRP